MNRTSEDWRRAATNSRLLAAYLSDPEAKRILTQTADECDAIAVATGELVELLPC
jgi:hypothetical protein